MWREENQRTRRKTLGVPTTKKLKPHNMAPGQHQTWAVLAGGEHSHHLPFATRHWGFFRTNVNKLTMIINIPINIHVTSLRIPTGRRQTREAELGATVNNIS